MTLNRLLHIALLPLLALSLALTGCDSDDPEPDMDALRGTWRATTVSVTLMSPIPGVSIPVPILDAGDEGRVTIMFEGDDQFSFSVEGPLNAEVPQVGTFPILGADDVLTNGGTYQVIENGDQIEFTTTRTNGETVPATSIEVDFDLRSDNAFVFMLDNSEEGRAALEFLLGDTFPPATFDLIEGGEARFERSSN